LWRISRLHRYRYLKLRMATWLLLTATCLLLATLVLAAVSY
jgi:hypothetical protein